MNLTIEAIKHVLEQEALSYICVMNIYAQCIRAVEHLPEALCSLLIMELTETLFML